MLGKKIQQLRKENGMSQEELASKLTISRQAISKWELGESMPDTENVVQLSKLFGVSTDFLLYDEYESEKDAQETIASAETPEFVLSGFQEEHAETEPGKSKFYKKPAFWIIIAAAIVLIALAVLLLSIYLFSVVTDPSQSASNSPNVNETTPVPSNPGLHSLAITYSGRQVQDFTLAVGDEVSLGISIPPVVSGYEVEWHSSDHSIFGVVLTNTTGTEAMVTAIGRGTATLTASVGGFHVECIVRVINRTVN